MGPEQQPEEEQKQVEEVDVEPMVEDIAVAEDDLNDQVIEEEEEDVEEKEEDHVEDEEDQEVEEEVSRVMKESDLKPVISLEDEIDEIDDIDEIDEERELQELNINGRSECRRI